MSYSQFGANDVGCLVFCSLLTSVCPCAMNYNSINMFFVIPLHSVRSFDIRIRFGSLYHSLENKNFSNFSFQVICT